jgi:hypothetical protein
MGKMEVVEYAGTNPTDCDHNISFNVVDRLCNPIENKG